MKQGVVKNLAVVILCSVLSLITGGMLGRWSRHGRAPSAPIIVSTPLPTPTLLPSPTPAPIRVYISGAVESPAVCQLPPGSIVQDAIDAAGGPTFDADLACINLALELQDQQHVHVPREGETDPPPVVSGGASRSGGGLVTKVNINTATSSELETLPGVGEVTAQRIVAHREANGPFERVEDIQNVSGIGAKTFEGLQDAITVDPK